MEFAGSGRSHSRRSVRHVARCRNDPTRTGTEPGGESASEQLRDALGDGGFSEAEADCVEGRLASEHGSVDEAMDAAEDDARLLLRPFLVCKEGMGLTDEYADCFGDGWLTALT